MSDPTNPSSSTANELQSDNNPIVNDCIKLFSIKDYVLESQVISTLIEFFQAGGDPKVVIDSLSTSYQGLGLIALKDENSEYANLMGSWLADLEMGPQFNSAHQPATASAQGKIEACQNVRDIYEQILTNKIQKVFNAEAADKMFEGSENENEKIKAIEWISELILHKAWRALIYDLAEKYPNCLMLNFAIKLISNAGFEHEINNVKTAVQQLDIFSRVFLSAVQQMLVAHIKGGENTEIYRKSYDRLVNIACHSEQTFLYTQAVLRVAGKRENGKMAAACEHIAQSLRLELANKRSEDVAPINVAILRSEIRSSFGEPINQAIIQSMLTMLCKQGTNPADISTLYEAYSEPNPPPIELIQDESFVELLIDTLFNSSSSRVNEEHLPKYVFLLSYAVSVQEARENGKREWANAELELIQTHMLRLYALVYSPDEFIQSVKEVAVLIKTPILAACLLHNIKTFIFKENSLSLTNNPLALQFALIDQIVASHPNLHARVFKVLCELFDHQSASDEAAELVTQRQRELIDRFIHLLYRGTVQPVIEKIAQMFKSGQIDVSLVRYFGIEVMEVVAPPYSKEFIGWFLPILSEPHVFDTKTLFKHPQIKNFIDLNAIHH